MTTHRMFRYRFLDNQGDRVEIILAEPGSIFVRSHDAAFAALWKAPPGDLRTWLSTMDITYATANLLVRSGCRFARTKTLDAAFTRDIAKWWGAFQAVLWVELAAPVAPTPCTCAIGACDLHEPVSVAETEPCSNPNGPLGGQVATFYVPAPVVAAEGRYAVLSECDGENYFLALSPENDSRRVGTHQEAEDEAEDRPGVSVVRILADGEHEAAVEAARREERERVLASIGPQRAHVLGAADRTNGVEAVRLYGQVDGLDYVRGLLGDEAAKGQAK